MEKYQYESQIHAMFATEKYPYESQIQAMMYGFGDVRKPRLDTVRVVHDILRDQIDILLSEAEEATVLRLDSQVSHKDLLFVMRKNKVKLKRLLEYLDIFDRKHQSTVFVRMTEGDVEPKELIDRSGKRVKFCLLYLSHIEDCEEFTSVMLDQSLEDYTLRRRIYRRNLMTANMTAEEYDEFTTQVIPASFCPFKKKPAFKQWLLKDNIVHDLTPLAVTIVNFLARETIAEIVDMALLLKYERNHKKMFCYSGRHDDSKDFFQEIIKVVNKEDTDDEEDSDFHHEDPMHDERPFKMLVDESVNISDDEVASRYNSRSGNYPYSDVSGDEHHTVENFKTTDLNPNAVWDFIACNHSESRGIDEKTAASSSPLPNEADSPDMTTTAATGTSTTPKRMSISSTTSGTSGTTSYRSASVLSDCTAITPNEVREVYFRYQELNQPLFYYASDTVPKKTKLLCLATSREDSFW